MAAVCHGPNLLLKYLIGLLCFSWLQWKFEELSFFFLSFGLRLTALRVDSKAKQKACNLIERRLTEANDRQA